jgi:hypothetical protein
MTVKRERRNLAILRLLVCAGAASIAAPCTSASLLSGLKPGPVDARSMAAADVAAASKTPGPYPKFSKVPPVPKDVRPTEGWRAAVLDASALKRQTETETAAVPFTLSDTEAFAAAERAKIPPDQTVAPTTDAAQDSEAFAAAARARATPPPSSN